MQFFNTKRYFSLADILVFLVIGAGIYGLIATGSQWRADYHQVTDIDLSFSALPKYALFSTMRSLVAYFLSLTFSIVVGYIAAKYRAAERIIIPAIDILQSVPVLGFLPGLVLALITLFPRTNTGLELVAIILVFTGQVWNMTFSFYSSLKSLPEDYKEASKIMGLDWWQKLTRVEIPYSAVNLAWNSLMSMAGGWFFLNLAESYTLGQRDYRLPGIGSYVSVAFKEGNVQAQVAGIITMMLIIVALDFIIWRPVLSFVRRFRLEETNEESVTEPLMLLALKDSRLIRFLTSFYKRSKKRRKRGAKAKTLAAIAQIDHALALPKYKDEKDKFMKILGPLVFVIFVVAAVYGATALIKTLMKVPGEMWWTLTIATFLTFLRVCAAILISTIWAVPLGIWIGLSQKRTQIAQPIIQILASFPAPMLYPLVLGIFFKLGMSINFSSIFLMLLGVQWYVLFNVLAGSLRISQQLGDTLSMMETSKLDRWKTLYLPSIFPALVTGWITAAGGAWNASIVAEYVTTKTQTMTANGLGAMITQATDHGDFSTLAAGLTIMVVFVVLLNRTFWAKLYQLAQTRYRLD